MTKYIQIDFIAMLAKLILAILVMVFSVASFFASINQATAAELQKHVTVTGSNITLGDVYHGVTDNADFVLAPAPLPHKTLVWDARTINRIARAFNLPAPSVTDQVTIRRLATIITDDMVKKAVMASLKEHDIAGNYDIEFLNNADATIILPQDMEASIAITEASFNTSRRTFSATLRTADNALHPIKGVIHPLIDIPVLKLTARRGDTIGQNDVTMLSIRADMLDDNMVIRKDALIGMTPRKIIAAKSPVTIADLEKPVMVKRGELVTMELSRGPIRLSAIAKALENGTEGDIIRLMNIDSKRTIEAEVTGLRTARVGI